MVTVEVVVIVSIAVTVDAVADGEEVIVMGEP